MLKLSDGSRVEMRERSEFYVTENGQGTPLHLERGDVIVEAAKQIKPGTAVEPTTGAALFHDAMKNLAALHHNDDIDPDSPHFNRQWDQSNWRIVMVRPRVNTKIFQLRLV